MLTYSYLPNPSFRQQKYRLRVHWAAIIIGLTICITAERRIVTSQPMNRALIQPPTMDTANSPRTAAGPLRSVTRGRFHTELSPIQIAGHRTDPEGFLIFDLGGVMRRASQRLFISGLME